MDLEKSNNIEIIDVEYTKAKISSRFLAFIVDIFILLFTTFIIFSFSNMAIQNMRFYTNLVDGREKLKTSSGLYLEDGTMITTYMDSDTQQEYNSNLQKKNKLSSVLKTFYSNDVFFDLTNNDGLKEYNERKTNAKHNDQSLFTFDLGEYLENNLDPVYFYDFYKDEVEYHAIQYLFNSNEYTNHTKTIFLILFIIFIVELIICYVVYFLVFPLTFLKRGRQTLGMKLFKISLISSNALNIKTNIFWLRFAFNLSIMLLLDLFAFLIPFILSVTMLYVTKTNQNLTNYVFNDYCVDSTNDDIYLNYFEYLDKKRLNEETRLENKNLTLK